MPLTSTNGTVFGVAPDSDIPVSEAHFSLPEDIAEASDGTIYVSDTQAHVIRRIRDGVVSVFAGTFAAGFNGDGAKMETALNTPTGMQLSPDEKSIFFMDSGNNLMRKIDLVSGVVSTIAGQQGSSLLPTAGTTALGHPMGYSVSFRLDADGNIWFPTTHSEGTVLEGGLYYIDPQGVIHQKTVAGVGPFVNVRDINFGPGYLDFVRGDTFFRVYDSGVIKQRTLETSFGKGIVSNGAATLVASHTNLWSLDADLNVTVAAESFANLTNVRKGAHGFLLTDSDQGVLYRYENGAKTMLSGTSPNSFGAMISVAKYTDSSVLILDNQRARIYLFDIVTGKAWQWAGIGLQSWASINNDKLETTFYYPNGLAVDSAKNVYVVEQHRILKIGADGKVNLLAGDEASGDLDGTGAEARFNSPGSISIDADGDVIVPDTYNNKVRKITPAGVVTTIAGSGKVDLPTFGVNARQSGLNHPLGVAVLPDGAVLIADGWNNAVYKLGADGILRPFAGKPNRTGYQGTGTFSGDGGAAVDAGMNTPSGMSVRDGTVYITDQFNQRVRVVRPDGVINTFAGSLQGFMPEGKLLSYPRDLMVFGNQLLVADTGNRIIVRYFLP